MPWVRLPLALDIFGSSVCMIRVEAAATAQEEVKLSPAGDFANNSARENAQMPRCIAGSPRQPFQLARLMC